MQLKSEREHRDKQKKCSSKTADAETGQLHFFARRNLTQIFTHSLQHSEKLEEASNHKSVVTHAGNVFVSRDLEHRPFLSQNTRVNFPGLVVEHFFCHV